MTKPFPIHPEDRHRIAEVPRAFIESLRDRIERNARRKLPEIEATGGVTISELCDAVAGQPAGHFARAPKNELTAQLRGILDTFGNEYLETAISTMRQPHIETMLPRLVLEQLALALYYDQGNQNWANATPSTRATYRMMALEHTAEPLMPDGSETPSES